MTETTVDADPPVSVGRLALARLLREWQFVAGAGLVLVVLLLALFAGLLAVDSPTAIHVLSAHKPPPWAHWFGTDSLGRDVASRVFYGARISLAIGFATVVATGLGGTAIGLIAGYVRRLDDPLMRVMDALMSFPGVMLAVAITAAIGPSSINAVIALTAVYVPRTARVVRSSVLVAREMDYVKAARAIGADGRRIMVRHILPNCLGPLIVQLTFVFAYAVLAEAALSFLGMGTPPPVPTLGNVIADGRDYVREAPWICFFPGMALLIVVLGLNLLGDGLRDALDPKMNATPQ